MGPEYLWSKVLLGAGFQHAFFTRKGGHSPPPFDSLHFGSVGHSHEILLANLSDASSVLGVDPDRLYLATQVHGRDVAVISGSENRDEVLEREADAIVSGAPGVGCGVKVADCVPILVADRDTGAVAAIHSGWQGTVANVAAAGVEALRRVTGHAGAGVLLAAIGPHIELCCFEVGEDVAARLDACTPGRPVDRRAGQRPHVDLRKIVRAQLLALGLSDVDIDDVRGCTQCDPTRFYSYRRDKDASGRHLAAIVARAKSATG